MAKIETEAIQNKLTTYEPVTLKAATDQSDSIKNYYNQYIKDQKLQEKQAYENNIAALDYQAQKLAPAYKQQREDTARDAEIAKQNFRQAAVTRGMNTGAGSQYALASQNQLQNDMTGIRKAELQALADVEQQRTQIKRDYQNAVAKAVSEGNLQMARALYDESVRVDESIVETARAQAQENYNGWRSSFDVNRAEKEDENENYDRLLARAETLAKYGDFSGYRDLGYTDAQIRAMYNLWYLQTYGSGGSGGGGGGSGRRSSSGSSGSGSSGSTGSNYVQYSGRATINPGKVLTAGKSYSGTANKTSAIRMEQ